MDLRSSSRKVWLLTLLSALMFFYGVLLGGLQYTMPGIAEGYGADLAGMGLLVSLQYMAAVIAPIPVGELADHHGKRGVLALFSLIFGIGCALCGFSGALGVYAAGVILTGAGYSVCESLTCAILSDIDPENGARWINLTQCLLCVGAVISPQAVRIAEKHMSAAWRAMYLTCAAAFVILAALILFSRLPSLKSGEKGAKDRGAGITKLFGSRVFVLLFVAVLLYVGLENGFGYFVESLFEEHLSAAEAGATAISLYWAGMALSRLFFTVKEFDVRRVLILCLFTAALAFVALLISQLLPLSLAVCFVVGAAYGPVWSMLIARAVACFPEHSAAASGTMSAGCGIGGIVYPALTGVIAARFSVSIAFVLLTATAVAAAVCCILLPRKGDRA